ncbi:uncharacterized protein LOC111066761 [Drosophila obscura]|uniref:uncharacterized protein LOC111066761 n=1 Tax=Drosophila obscura TaxID=7282 RepID=UPI001BB2089E|nr:uncharacterized protein LOC111066761 [Drosophila obscura]
MSQTKLTRSTIGWLLLLLVTVHAEDAVQATNNTIVVHTPLQNYGQPTLRDYEECQANRGKCLDVCGGDGDCQDECPLCPELYDKPLMVQGVNDTDVLAPAQTPINTTNIIRLTNEINNIIQHDIKNRNEVNVQVQQNVSQVGGRFGLGYNDQGSCCFVVRRSRDCERKESRDCQEWSRQRVCGERCQARVMLAKLVVQCDADEPTKCHETIEYVPRRRKSVHRNEYPGAAGPCRYLGNSWPYVSCGGGGQAQAQGQRVKRSSCQQCLNLPYGYILQSGLPVQCSGCFQGYAAPLQPQYYAPYAMPFNPYPQYAPFAPPSPSPCPCPTAASAAAATATATTTTSTTDLERSPATMPQPTMIGCCAKATTLTIASMAPMATASSQIAVPVNPICQHRNRTPSLITRMRMAMVTACRSSDDVAGVNIIASLRDPPTANETKLQTNFLIILKIVAFRS